MLKRRLSMLMKGIFHHDPDFVLLVIPSCSFLHYSTKDFVTTRFNLPALTLSTTVSFYILNLVLLDHLLLVPKYRLSERTLLQEDLIDGLNQDYDQVRVRLYGPVLVGCCYSI